MVGGIEEPIGVCACWGILLLETSGAAWYGGICGGGAVACRGGFETGTDAGNPDGAAEGIDGAGFGVPGVAVVAGVAGAAAGEGCGTGAGAGAGAATGFGAASVIPVLAGTGAGGAANVVGGAVVAVGAAVSGAGAGGAEVTCAGSVAAGTAGGCCSDGGSEGCSDMILTSGPFQSAAMRGSTGILLELSVSTQCQPSSVNQRKLSRMRSRRSCVDQAIA